MSMSLGSTSAHWMGKAALRLQKPTQTALRAQSSSSPLLVRQLATPAWYDKKLQMKQRAHLTKDMSIMSMGRRTYSTENPIEQKQEKAKDKAAIGVSEMGSAPISLMPFSSAV